MNANQPETKEDVRKPDDDAVPFDELPQEQQALFIEVMKRSGMDPGILTGEPVKDKQ